MYKLEDIRSYCEQYGKKKVIVDTNLLLLLLVGSFDKEFIKDCAATNQYSQLDYDLLLKVLRYFKSEIVITPYLLAELSDFSIKDIKPPKLHYYFMTLIDRLRNYKEENITLEKLLEIKFTIIMRFGFPDISILEVAKSIGAVVLTDDFDLALYANKSRIPNINFRTVRATDLISVGT